MGFLKNMFFNNQCDNIVLSKPLLQLNGLTGLLKLYDDKIVIDRSKVKPLYAKHLKTENVILLNDVSEIHLKTSARYLRGYIRFVLIGGDGSSLSVMKVGKDDNTVITTTHNDEFMFIFVDKILELYPSILVIQQGDNSESGANDFISKVMKTVSLGIAYVGEEMLKSKTGVRYKGTMAQREMFSNIKSSSASVSSSQYTARKENPVHESADVGSNADVDKGDMFEQYVVDLFNLSLTVVTLS